jgi:hypothetical protein
VTELRVGGGGVVGLELELECGAVFRAGCHVVVAKQRQPLVRLVVS